MIILNNNKYSAHCTLSWVFSKHFRNVIYFSHHLLSFLLIWGNSEGGTVIVWEYVVMNIIGVALQLVCYYPHCTLHPLMGTSIS